MAATERIPLLVTPTQVNEFVRRAAEVYNPTDDDEGVLQAAAMAAQQAKAACRNLSTAARVSIIK